MSVCKLNPECPGRVKTPYSLKEPATSGLEDNAQGTGVDLLVFDLEHPWRNDPALFRSKSKNSPFEGHPVQGRVLRTVVDGRTIHHAES